VCVCVLLLCFVVVVVVVVVVVFFFFAKVIVQRFCVCGICDLTIIEFQPSFCGIFVCARTYIRVVMATFRMFVFVFVRRNIQKQTGARVCVCQP